MSPRSWPRASITWRSETVATYRIKNLDCADCAARLEKRLQDLTSVRYASLNFASLNLVIDTDDIEEVKREMSRIEPAVELSSLDEARDGGGAPEKMRELAFVAAAVAAYALVFVAERLPPGGAPRWLVPAGFAALWLAAGFRVMKEAASNLLRGRIFDENFLMSIATMGAFAIGAYSEAAGVMVFYRIGEYLEELSLDRSRRSIERLLSLKPDSAEVVRDGRAIRLSPDLVEPGETVRVRPGERVPLDGVVLTGVSSLDTSPITGESMPVPVAEGDEAPAGSLNRNGLLELRVTRPFGESSVARIMRLVEESSARKSKTERFMTKFARYYTPAVMATAALAAVLPPLLVSGESFVDWLYRALVILVISCPCALVVSIPLGYFGGIGGAAKRGILVKGSSALDALSRAGVVAFDKTGTLTKGVFSVLAVRPASGFDEAGLLACAARAEAGSNHPIANSLAAAYGAEPGAPEEFKESPGLGVAAVVDGKRVLAGNSRFLERAGIAVPPYDDAAALRVHVAVDAIYAGAVELGDEVRPESAAAVAELGRLGIPSVALLSGDSAVKAEAVGRSLGLKDARGGLLPEDKAAALRSMRRDGASVVFVGDGINDAPVLAEADVGVAMGGIGQDAAVETADVVILNDDPGKVAEAIAVARRTRRIVTQNIVFALGIKLAFVAGGLAGLAGMWEAVFADVGVAVLAVLNSMRSMGPPEKP